MSFTYRMPSALTPLSSVSPLELVDELVARSSTLRFEGGQDGNGVALIDVRSEGEFQDSGVPHFQNIPVLTNPERHEVGTAYKQRGREEAIELGFRFFEPQRAARIAAWSQAILKSRIQEAWVTCWRGGLRSRLACGFMSEQGLKCRQVSGGTKAIRNRLLETFLPERLPPLWVLSGWTGAGKTELLHEMGRFAVDFEGLAHHRGSSFGAYLGQVQPSQTTFENRLAIELLAASSPPKGAEDPLSKKLSILVEDESARIGKVSLPRTLKAHMYQSRVLILEAPLEERALRVFEGYIREPAEQGGTFEEIRSAMLASLLQIRDRLGGVRFDEARKAIEAAFAQSIAQGIARFEEHQSWIELLLAHYYDRSYRNAFERQPRNIVFRGNRQECREFLREQERKERNSQ